jgi:hypothetical protein
MINLIRQCLHIISLNDRYAVNNNMAGGFIVYDEETGTYNGSTLNEGMTLLLAQRVYERSSSQLLGAEEFAIDPNYSDFVAMIEMLEQKYGVQVQNDYIQNNIQTLRAEFNRLGDDTWDNFMTRLDELNAAFSEEEPPEDVADILEELYLIVYTVCQEGAQEQVIEE